MHIATQLFDIRKGDEVIVTPTTFIATSLVVLKEGRGCRSTPISTPGRTTSTRARIEKKITPKTKAIYVVHYGGLMCDMDPIMEIARKHKLFVLEDCAHAVNAEYKGRQAGSVGDIGVFSFHSLKNITTCGEGGMITTNNDVFAKGAEKLRCMNLIDWDPGQTRWKFGPATLEKKSRLDYWMPSHFDVDDWNGHWGNNYRMNEIQAAVGVAQLDKLEMLTEKRRDIGHRITAGLTGIKGITPVHEPADYKHVFHLYTVCVEEKELGASRDEFLRVLYREEGDPGHPPLSADLPLHRAQEARLRPGPLPQRRAVLLQARAQPADAPAPDGRRCRGHDPGDPQRRREGAGLKNRNDIRAAVVARLDLVHSRARHDFPSEEILLDSSLRSSHRFARGTMPLRLSYGPLRDPSLTSPGSMPKHLCGDPA